MLSYGVNPKSLSHLVLEWYQDVTDRHQDTTHQDRITIANTCYAMLALACKKNPANAKGMRNSGGCLKARCELNLRSPILATMFLSHSLEGARWHNQSRSAILA